MYVYKIIYTPVEIRHTMHAKPMHMKEYLVLQDRESERDRVCVCVKERD